MRNSKKVTTVVLVGAVGLASAAYGIGSQVGDGSASAGSGAGSTSSSSAADRSFDRGGPPGFEDLADELGVDANALEDALREFHDQEANSRRTEFTDALASALGISAAKVTSALDQLGEQKRERFAKRLANELGVDAAKVQTALDELADERPDRGDNGGPGGPGDFAEDLAAKLGVDADEVEDALFAQRPDRGMRDRDHARQPLRQLATALGVSRAELRKAFREVRAGADDAWEKRQDALVQFLADRFNLSEAKVEQALGDLPGPRGPGGRGGPGGPDHGGPGGPGGPGPFGP